MNIRRIVVLSALLSAAGASNLPGVEAHLLAAIKIWDQAPHNAPMDLAQVKLSEAKPIPESSKVVPLDFVHVCQDAGAGGYEAFPDVCRLRDGRLMCVFYAGYGHVARPTPALPKGGRIAYCTSSDEGRTWSAAQTLYDGPDDDRDPSITQLRDGRLLCNYFVNGEGVHQIFSEDLGKTWSAPGSITATHYASSPVRELSGGRLGLGLYNEKDGRAAGAFTYSDDGGRTWSKPIDIDNAGQYLDAETDVIELKNGSLYSVHRGGKGAQMHWTLSQDRGRTWGKSQPIGFTAHCPYLHRAAGDIVLLAYRKPAPGPWTGTGLSYSIDECKTWSEPVKVDQTIGAYPSMVNLKDGSVLIVYYEEGAGSSIRARRFRASPQGVQWLSLKSASSGKVEGLKQ